MSTTIARYPHLEDAFTMLGRPNDMVIKTNIKTVVVPQAWLQRFEEAESTAAELRVTSLDSYLTEAQLGDDAEGDENALEYFCDGEESVVDMLKHACDGATLHEVLNAAFDGELQELVYEN